MPTKRAVCYVRLSSYRGEADASTSPKVQEDRTRAYCIARGWEVAEVVRDLDVSGSARGARLDRPGIRRIRELYRNGAVDVVVALRLDRLARNTRDLLELIEDAEKNGAAVATVEGSIDTGSPSGRLILTILGAVAEMEAEQIRERTAAGRAEALRQGRWVGGVPQYGTRAIDNPDGGGKVLEVDPDEASVLRRMMRLYLDGHGAPAIARRLNADGIPAKKGGKWKLHVVLKTLRQHADASMVLTGPERYALAAELDARSMKRSTTVPDGGKSLLSAVLKCATCGSGLYLVPRQGKTRPTYRCSTRVGDPPRLHARVIAEEAEALIVGAFLDDWAEYRPSVRIIPEAQWDIDVAAARDVVEALEADLTASKGKARREVLERLEAAEEAVQAFLNNPPPRVPIFRRGTVTVGEEWAKVGQLERRQLLKKYLGTVHCTPARDADGKLRTMADRLTIPRIDDAEPDTQPTMKEKIPTDG